MRVAAALLMLVVALVALQAQPAPQILRGGIVSAADNSSAESGIAPGSLLTIYGFSLGDRVQVAAESAAPPTELAGTTVRVRVPASAVEYKASLLYVSPSQINAIMPNGIAPGMAEVWVETATGQSTRQPVLIVAARFTAFTRSGRPFGPAIIQQFGAGGVRLNRLLDPAVPRQALVIWGTGLGHHETDDVMVYFDRVDVKPFYAGPAPTLPGVDQVNVLLPNGIPNDCFVPLAVSVAGRMTSYTLSVADAPGPCPTQLPIGPDGLLQLDVGGAIQVTGLSIQEWAAEAWVGDYDAAHLAQLATYDSRPFGSDLVCASRAHSYDRYIRPLPLPPDPVELHGMRRIDEPLEVAITGPSGCRWTFSSSTDGVYRATAPPGCAAQNYSIRRATTNSYMSNNVALAGPRPEPAQLTFDSASGRASWSDSVTGRLTFVLSSSFTLHGSIFSGKTDVRELTCRLSGAAGTASVRDADLDFALGLPDKRRAQAYQWTGDREWTNWGNNPTSVLLTRVLQAFVIEGRTLDLH